MASPRILVLTGYGINCEEETAFAFENAGGRPDIVHINDIIQGPGMLNEYQAFTFPGGFAYGDDTGSGKALANRIKNNLFDEFMKFIERDTLMLGICNGFQVMANLGIVPALNSPIGRAEVSLEHNVSARYQCRWVSLIVEESPSVFTRGIKTLRVPVAHGEGNFYAPDDILNKLEENRQVVMRYAGMDGSRASGEFPYNPNGSMNDIAAVCDTTGRIMGMMPHPERNIFFTQRDLWTLEQEIMLREGRTPPEESEGLAIFRNAVGYFQ